VQRAGHAPRADHDDELPPPFAPALEALPNQKHSVGVQACAAGKVQDDHLVTQRFQES
jgi:hypothetical protein